MNPIFPGLIFVRVLFGKLFLKKRLKMDHTKIVPVDLDSPRREIFARSLRFVVLMYVDLLVYSGNDFSCACTWGEMQLY